MSKPNEKRFKAQTLWQKGLPYEKISKRLDVPVGTLRRWKSTYKWERSDDPNTRTDETENKTRGAQKGNVNSVGNGGGGAPLGNTNSQTHGGYSSISIDFLSEEERAFFDAEQTLSERNMLLEEVALQKIRERRVFLYIDNLKKKKKGKENFDAILKAEETLTRIQSAMSKSIATLHQMGVDDRMIELREKEFEAKLSGKNKPDKKKNLGKLVNIMEQLK